MWLGHKKGGSLASPRREGEREREREREREAILHSTLAFLSSFSLDFHMAARFGVKEPVSAGRTPAGN